MDAKAESTTPKTAEIAKAIHALAAKLAGVESIARRYADDVGSGGGDELHLAADAAHNVNESLSRIADDIHYRFKPSAEAFARQDSGPVLQGNDRVTE